MRSSITTRRRVAAAGGRSIRAAAAGWAVRSPSGRRVAADQRVLDRASHPPVALPGVPREDQRRVAGGDRRLAVRAAAAGGDRDVDRRHRFSRRGIGELARDLFGVTLSTGAVDAICQRASDALAGPHCSCRTGCSAAAVHVDETGWRTSGEAARCGPRTPPAPCSCRSPSTATASSSTR